MAFWNRKEREEQKPLMEEKVISAFPEAEKVADRETDVPKLTPEKVTPVGKQDKKRYVRECCESIGEIDHQIADAKREYEQVTSGLTDIQKIDRIHGEERTELEDTCKKIIQLTRERNRYKNRNLTITETQIRRFEPYEDSLVDEIKKMYGAETYQKAIESDMEYLEEEKKKLHQQQKEIIEKQNALKGMAKVLIALILSLFILFLVIYYALEVDMTLPYLGTILLAAVSSTVIFVESNRNRSGMVLAERKLSRAITLLNRVKIKYINNRNVLDYNCEKFSVKDAADFEHLWTEYCKAREYEKKFRENTEQLNFCSECLVSMLRENQVKDAEIWNSRAAAIIDNREMVEIRHELNQRRGKLRERIAYNEEEKSRLVSEIDEILQENPAMEKDIVAIVEEYNQKS